MGDLPVIWSCTFLDLEISRPPTRVSRTRPVPSQLSNINVGPRTSDG